jgi:hypothetical protein
MSTSDQANITLSEQASVAIREHLSIRHMRSAAILASQARVMEGAVEDPLEWSESRWDECAALANACMFMSVAGLEAAINEIYIGAHSANPHDGLSDPLRTMLSTRWSKGFKAPTGMSKIVFKCECALECAEDLNKSPILRPATDDAALLIRTRNALTHATEKFQPAAPHGPATLWRPLEQQLRERVCPSALTPPSAMYLWCRVLGAPLAEWAFRTAHEYASAVYAALGATNIFAAERSRLP